MSAKTQDAVIVPFHGKPKRRNSARVGWVVVDNGCHIWRGSRTADGYGHVNVDGRMECVHRVRYEREVGPIPEGMHLDHYVCDDPLCCNPAHVRPVAQRENTLRGASPSAQNAAKTHCKRGHPLSGDNLYVMPRTGRRQCRACHRARQRARHRASGAADHTPEST